MLKMNYFQIFCFLFAYCTVGHAIREALDEEFPFQVSIKSVDNRHLCGGTILTPRWVLTSSICLNHMNEVIVSYGSADSNNPLNSIRSEKIILQNEFVSAKKSRFALIRLVSPIKFTETVKAGKLPLEKVQLRNTTKLSGWNIDQHADVPPSLFVTDEYMVITENCKTETGSPVFLEVDEFCGQDKDGKNELVYSGSIVSKAGIVLGLLPSKPITVIQPPMFVKLSEHEQWIRDTLGPDAQYVTWVDKIPKNSANSQTAVSLILFGISAIFLRIFY